MENISTTPTPPKKTNDNGSGIFIWLWVAMFGLVVLLILMFPIIHLINYTRDKFVKAWRSACLCCVHRIAPRPQMIMALQSRQYNTEQQTCSICLGDMNKHQKLKGPVACNHYFHESCIKKWGIETSSCPICRKLSLVVGSSTVDKCSRNYDSNDYNSEEEAELEELRLNYHPRITSSGPYDYYTNYNSASSSEDD